MGKVAVLLWVMLGLAFPGYATTLERGVSPAIQYENPPLFEEVYRIKVENKVGGTIEVSEDKGQNWIPVGKVLYPTQKVSEYGYAAAKWIGAGRVAASAVNAIHVKVGAADEKRSIFSILPKDFLKAPSKYRSFLSPDSSIYTDIPAGESIFGKGFAPFVGNVVMLSTAAQPVMSLPQDYVPKLGDTFYILVDRPIDYPREIVFENRFGGRISISYFTGEEKVIGEVLRPVTGVGRFEGSKFVDPGRIRANHGGVIDISVSPIGSLGGFQIVPALHGQDMGYVQEKTQWMVIGPKNVEDRSLEGMAPFFKFFIQPSYDPNGLDAKDWEESLLSRFLVEVRIKGKNEWYPMPVYSLYRGFPLPGWADSALNKVTHFRILFPMRDS
ncbi:MAG: hypothetical protein ABIA67_01800 [Candidatus Margulisiibacteriota bacterium]